MGAHPEAGGLFGGRWELLSLSSRNRHQGPSLLLAPNHSDPNTQAKVMGATMGVHQLMCAIIPACPCLALQVWARKYDQRVIYSHAALALSSLDVSIINIDLDEYLVTSSPGLHHQNIQAIIEGCAGMWRALCMHAARCMVPAPHQPAGLEG